MTEHLPECPHSEPDLNPGFLVMCICGRLRACEQRLREGWCVSSCGNTHYTIGYEEGLDAAREAVAALPCMAGRGQDRHPRHVDDFKDAVLAAIRALKEKP